MSDVSIEIIVNLFKTKNLEKKNSFTLKQSDDNCIVYLQNLTIYKTIVEILKTEKIKFFTFTPKNYKLKNIVLKGVCGDFSEEDIKNDINDLKLQFITIHKIYKIKPKNTDNNNKNHCFLIQLTNDSILQNLTKVKYIAYQKIY